MKNVSHALKEINYTGPVVECATFRVFLDALRCSDRVLLSPVERLQKEQDGTILQQFAVHLTARSLIEEGNPVYYGTWLAAEMRTVGKQGRLVFPFQQEHLTAAAPLYVRQLVQDLHHCLEAELRADARILEVFSPARYRLPDAWVWSLSSLEGSQITFQDGRWTHPSVPLFIAEPDLWWVRQFLLQDEKRIRRVCAAYRVTNLSLLTVQQARHLISRLKKQAAHQKGGGHA